MRLTIYERLRAHHIPAGYLRTAIRPALRKPGDGGMRLPTKVDKGSKFSRATYETTKEFGDRSGCAGCKRGCCGWSLAPDTAVARWQAHAPPVSTEFNRIKPISTEFNLHFKKFMKQVPGVWGRAASAYAWLRRDRRATTARAGRERVSFQFQVFSQQWRTCRGGPRRSAKPVYPPKSDHRFFLKSQCIEPN